MADVVEVTPRLLAVPYDGTNAAQVAALGNVEPGLHWTVDSTGGGVLRLVSDNSAYDPVVIQEGDVVVVAPGSGAFTPHTPAVFGERFHVLGPA